ncbi:hypothetical protein B0I26_108103 [Anoxybacillus vitaminiphilus]|uniref:Uncharacterized protein n=1 Tax=Paranoxybacillus vitaminiphilus TaxID=581036 RepID=A0A327YCW5_9BACL|nr:hypothetical protein B0I26_108103 [Anoxybacillus vitaminiphilus]
MITKTNIKRQKESARTGFALVQLRTVTIEQPEFESSPL